MQTFGKISASILAHNNKSCFFILVVLAFLFHSNSIRAQADTSNSASINDTIKKASVRIHKPLKAVLFSAALPGLGQAYNRKYWKIPIIYAGLGVASYFLYDQNKKYQCFRKAYIMKVDGDPLTDGSCTLKGKRYTGTQEIETAKNYYRRNIDLISALMVLWYGLNLVDAAVDAHLFHFDVSDNLSLRIAPDIHRNQSIQQSYTSLGIALTINM